MCVKRGPPARPARGICNEPWTTGPPLPINVTRDMASMSYTITANGNATTISDLDLRAGLRNIPLTAGITARQITDTPSLGFTDFSPSTLRLSIDTTAGTSAGGNTTWQPLQPNLGFFARRGRQLDTALSQCAASARAGRRSIRSISASNLRRMRNAGSTMPSMSGFWSRRLRPVVLAALVGVPVVLQISA